MSKKRISVSFDFDGTLSDHFQGKLNPHKEAIQKLFQELYHDDNFDVYLVTRRFGPENSDKGLGCEHEGVLELLNKLNIVLPPEKLVFTNRQMKYYTVVYLGIDIHLDDEFRDRELINKFTKGSAVDATQSNWRQKFDELL